jgi:GTP cyclohydrolase II
MGSRSEDFCIRGTSEMPIFINIIDEQRLVLTCHHGAVSDEEVITAYERLYRTHPERATYDKLVDLRKSDATARDPETLKGLANLVEQYLRTADGKQRVVIVASKDLEFGLGRMYQAFANESLQRVDVVRAPDEAMAALEIKDVESAAKILEWFEAPD